MPSLTQVILDKMNGVPSQPETSVAEAKPVMTDELKEFREELRSRLHVGTWVVEFNKVDGTPAIMECTLDGRLLPSSVGKSPNKALTENLDTLRVYATDRQGWRSFRVANVTKVYQKLESL